jgi:hypothetical protein
MENKTEVEGLAVDILVRMQQQLGWAWDDIDDEGPQLVPHDTPAEGWTILEWHYGADFFGIHHYFDKASGYSTWATVEPQWPLNNRSWVNVHRHRPGKPTEEMYHGAPAHKGISLSFTKEGVNASVVVGTHSTNKADIQPDFSRPIYLEKLLVRDMFPA